MQIDPQKALPDGQYCFRLVSRIDLAATLPLEDETAQALAPAVGYHLAFVVVASGFAQAAGLVETRLHEIVMGSDPEEPGGFISTIEAEVIDQKTVNQDWMAARETQPEQARIVFESKRCYFSREGDAQITVVADGVG